MLNSIVVIVRGGMVQSVHGDINCNVEVIDYDDMLDEDKPFSDEKELVAGLKQLW